MNRLQAHAKINLALVVGPTREDGLHEVATVLQRIDLHDDIALAPATQLVVEGFADDTLVRAALGAVAERAGVEPRWRATLDKRIPVAAGLGGGSSDAAAALLLANAALPEPIPRADLHRIAADIGADVPFFLEERAQLATGDGTELHPLDLPLDYLVVLVLPEGEVKSATAAVYSTFDERDGARGFEERRSGLAEALARVSRARDLSALPHNDLASSPVSEVLERLGAFRADVSGAGPTVYGLFEDERVARSALEELVSLGRTWLTRPV